MYHHKQPYKLFDFIVHFIWDGFIRKKKWLDCTRKNPTTTNKKFEVRECGSVLIWKKQFAFREKPLLQALFRNLSLPLGTLSFSLMWYLVALISMLSTFQSGICKFRQIFSLARSKLAEIIKCVVFSFLATVLLYCEIESTYYIRQKCGVLSVFNFNHHYHSHSIPPFRYMSNK